MFRKFIKEHSNPWLYLDNTISSENFPSVPNDNSLEIFLSRGFKSTEKDLAHGLAKIRLLGEEIYPCRWLLTELLLENGVSYFSEHTTGLSRGFKNEAASITSKKRREIRSWKRFISSLTLRWKHSSSLNGIFKVGLVLSICVLFPSKASACFVNNNELDPNLVKQKRELLVRVLVVGIGVAAVATLSYALLCSPKVKLSDRLLAASKFVGLSSGVVNKIPEFLNVPDFLPMPVSPDIAAELNKTLTFLRKAQFDKSYSDPGNKFMAEALLRAIFGRVDGLLSYRNSPDFNPVAMRSIESSVFIMCRKNQHIKDVCANLSMDRLLAKLAVSLYNHQNRTKGM